MALQAHFNTIVAFGDSFSSQCGFDTAPNAMRWTNFSHGLHNNPILRDCGLSGGWNYLNFLSDCTTDRIDPLNCPIKLIDLAHGSALAYKNSSLSEQQESEELPAALQLPGQLAQWNEHVRPELSFKLDRTLGVIWFGINDCQSFLSRNLEKALEDKHATTLEESIGNHLDVMGMAIAQLHKDGLRSMMIPNVALNIAGAAGLINTWNRLLRSRLEQWREAYTDSTFYDFDTYATFNEFRGHPEEYGFINVDDACFSARHNQPGLNCADTSSGYLMMDWVHWTSHAHFLLSQLMENSILRQMEQRDKKSGILWNLKHIDTPVHGVITLLGALSVVCVSFTLGWFMHRRRSAMNRNQKYVVIKNEENTV